MRCYCEFLIWLTDNFYQCKNWFRFLSWEQVANNLDCPDKKHKGKSHCKAGLQISCMFYGLLGTFSQFWGRKIALDTTTKIWQDWDSDFAKKSVLSSFNRQRYAYVHVQGADNFSLTTTFAILHWIHSDIAYQMLYWIQNI